MASVLGSKPQGPVPGDGLFCDFSSLFQKSPRAPNRQLLRQRQLRRRCGVVAAVCCGSGRVSNGPTRFSGVAAGLCVSSSGIFNNSTVGYTKKMKNDAIDGAVLQFQQVCFFIPESTENRGGRRVQYICRIVDMTVLQHQDSDPDSLE